MSGPGPSVAVIGLGKIGLAVAGYLLDRGLSVAGCDRAAERAEHVAEGEIAQREPGLATALAAGISSGRLTVHTDAAEAVRGRDVVLVIVPAHAHSLESIDVSALEDVAARVPAALKPGALLVVETTVPVGTTRRLFGPAIGKRNTEERAGIGLAYSPERVDVGAVWRDLRAYPKVVGGADAASAERAAAFYERVGAPVLQVGSLETAEFTKLVETTYRYVNIGLANEFAISGEAMGVDAIAAIAAANSQPYSHVHAPGIGVGGACIPVYPWFYEKGAPAAGLVRAARAVNTAMVDRAVASLDVELGGLRGRTVLILGLGFRSGIKDSANSPTFDLASRLRDAGARPVVLDPHFSPGEIERAGLDPADPDRPADAVVLVTPHRELVDPALLRRVSARVLVDGRNAFDPEAVASLGVRYVGIGR